MANCYYCGQRVEHIPSKVGVPRPKHARTVDHVIPKCRGGQRTDQNAVIACSGCNEEKGQLTGPEYKAVLAFRAGHKELFKLWYTKFREEKYDV